MTALEKLSIGIKPTDVYVADEFFNAFRNKCPDEFFQDAIKLCEKCYSCDNSFRVCVKCWLQEVSE